MSIQTQIDTKLATLDPLMVEVVNESHMHSVPANSETHFKVTLVSDRFSGLSRVKRHQQLYALLSEELDGPVHALALQSRALPTGRETPRLQVSSTASSYTSSTLAMKPPSDNFALILAPACTSCARLSTLPDAASLTIE